MRIQKVEGVIIKRRNLGDASRILSVFTSRNGKIQVKAPNIRKIPSRRSAHLELLNLSFLTLYKSTRSIMPIVSEASTLNSFEGVKQDLSKVGFAYHICELVEGLCPENQENKSVFELLKQTLESLDKGEEETALLIHSFEVELLTLLGFWPARNYPREINTHSFIENILERKLKSLHLIPRLK